ncbi:MAG: flagellar hook-basal body complex protein FliE [Gemmatimonadaceae bacterium]
MSDPIGAARMGLGTTQTGGADQAKRYTADLGKDAPASGAGSFGDTIAGFIDNVSRAQDAAGDLQQRYLAGEQIELHQMTAAAEEAGIALDLMVEIRNKVLDAYRTLVNMQS